MRESLIYQEILQEGRQEGIQEGRQEGRQEGIEEVALKMLLKNIPIEAIAELTGLTLAQIQQLQAQI